MPQHWDHSLVSTVKENGHPRLASVAWITVAAESLGKRWLMKCLPLLLGKNKRWIRPMDWFATGCYFYFTIVFVSSVISYFHRFFIKILLKRQSKWFSILEDIKALHKNRQNACLIIYSVPSISTPGSKLYRRTKPNPTLPATDCTSVSVKQNSRQSAASVSSC